MKVINWERIADTSFFNVEFDNGETRVMSGHELFMYQNATDDYSEDNTR